MNNIYLNLFHKSGHENPYDDFFWRMEGSDLEVPAFCPKCHRALNPCTDFDNNQSDVYCAHCGVVYQVFPGHAIFNRPFEAIMLMSVENPVEESDLKTLADIVPEITQIPTDSREYTVEELYKRHKKSVDGDFSKETDALVSGSSEEGTSHVEALMKAMEELDKKNAEEKIHPAPSDKPGDVKDTLFACHDLCGCKRDSTEVAKVMLGVGEEEGPKEKPKEDKSAINVQNNLISDLAWVEETLKNVHGCMRFCPMPGDVNHAQLRAILNKLENYYVTSNPVCIKRGSGLNDNWMKQCLELVHVALENTPLPDHPMYDKLTNLQHLFENKAKKDMEIKGKE